MKSQTGHDPMLDRLEQGVASSVELEAASNLSQASVARRLRSLIDEGRVIRIGNRRGARYGRRRLLRDLDAFWPLNRVNAEGEIEELGRVHPLYSDEYYLEADRRATDIGFAVGGLTHGLPYNLQDQRPGGFLGPAVPLRYPDLEVPQRVSDWSDDHYLRYLTRHGSDTVGDLILGRAALDEYLALRHHRSPIALADRSARFVALADQVMQGGLPGSSAHGEHPKFTALLQEAGTYRHVIVKFSPPVHTAVGQRWADLLRAEHHAHAVLREADIASVASRTFRAGERTFLEMTRFDRVGLEGRIGVASLVAIDTTRYGKLDNWIAAAMRLHADRCIEARTLEQVKLVATFGALIGNTDRHFGNLAFYDRYDGRFTLAPIYDMLPMLFAPVHDQVIERVFEPPVPDSGTYKAWEPARELAQAYWKRLMNDADISMEFRAISEVCLRALRAMPSL